MFRILRPLRIISRNEGLRASVIALALAIPNIISIVLIALLFFIIFGIIGINYLKGQYYYCVNDFISEFDVSLLPAITKWNCIDAGGLWIN
jgi:hypothetical protein